MADELWPNELKVIENFLETCVIMICLTRRTYSPNSDQKKTQSHIDTKKQNNDHIIENQLQYKKFEDIITKKDIELDRLRTECTKLQSTNISKMQNYIVKLTDLCNSKSSQINALQTELNALKKSKSSSAILSKLNEECEAHTKTKVQLNEAMKKNLSLNKELNEMKAKKIDEISSKIKDLDSNGTTKYECNDNVNICQKKNSNDKITLNIEDIDPDQLDSKTLKFIQYQVEQKNAIIKNKISEINDQKQQIEDIQADLQAVQFQYSEILRFSDTMTSENVKLKQKLSQNLTKMDEMISQINILSQDLNKSRSDFNSREEKLKQQLSSANYEIQELRLTNSDLESKLVNNTDNQLMSTDPVNNDLHGINISNNKVDTNMVENLRYDLRQKQKLINELNRQISIAKTKLMQRQISNDDNYDNNDAIGDYDPLLSNNDKNDKHDSQTNNKIYMKDYPKDNSKFYIEKINDLKNELKIKNKLIRYYMIQKPDLDVSMILSSDNIQNAYISRTDATLSHGHPSMNIIGIYNESITKMQKILEEEIIKNIDLTEIIQNLSMKHFNNSSESNSHITNKEPNE